MENEQQPVQQVHKVILSSGKEVLVRPMKIKYQHLALKAIGSSAENNQALLGSMMQDELLKILVIQVGGKPVDAKLIQNLDNYFEYEEYIQLLSFMGQLMGGQSSGKFQTEFVSI